jgi:hypothetical protein
MILQRRLRRNVRIADGFPWLRLSLDLDYFDIDVFRLMECMHGRNSISLQRTKSECIDDERYPGAVPGPWIRYSTAGLNVDDHEPSRAHIIDL